MSKAPAVADRKQKTRWLAAYRVLWNSGGRASGSGQLYEIDSMKSRRDASAAAARLMDTSCELRSCFIEVSYVWPSAPVLMRQQFEGTQTNTAIAIDQRGRCADTATLEAPRVGRFADVRLRRSRRGHEQPCDDGRFRLRSLDGCCGTGRQEFARLSAEKCR